jgi:sec-independent protein translocase protein TatC
VTAVADPAVGMSLAEHLRELRKRLVRSGIAIAAGMVIGWIYYDRIFAWLSEPFTDIVAEAQAQGRTVVLALTGVADPFTLQLQIAAMVGVIIAAPVWLYQIWRFITPGLHRHERRWALGFAAAATPLFLAGVLMAYWVLPSGLALLFGFTPAGVENIVSVDRYLDFFVRTILVFGVGFLLPLLVVLLNFAGLLTGQTLISWWRAIILIVFVFAAIATPTGDPWNMALLAAPILLLVSIAVGICVLNDKRRARKRSAQGYDQWDDDEASLIEPAGSEFEPPEPTTSS